MPIESPVDADPSRVSSRHPITITALAIGMTVPFLYYGTQIVAAPFFPGYSFMSQAASLLGSDHSTRPSIFNAGVIATGIATLIAALGFFLSFRRLGIHPFLTWITSICLVLHAASSVWAGYFPLPDPRHGGHPALLIAMILLPFLLAASLWRQPGARWLKVYLVATILLLVAMIPIMSGMTGLDTHSYSGLLQRFFALTVFPPIAVCSFYLARLERHLQL